MGSPAFRSPNVTNPCPFVPSMATEHPSIVRHAQSLPSDAYPSGSVTSGTGTYSCLSHFAPRSHHHATSPVSVVQLHSVSSR